jgi:hypothetical protein
VAVVERNFPYAEFTAPWRQRPLWRASLSVARQYLAAQRAGFAAVHRPAVRALLAQAEETTFLAGSCGLALLGALQLPREDLARISFIAFGAVAHARPSCPGVVVLGERDGIARGRGPAADRRVRCGHLEYLADAEFAAISREFVRNRLAARASQHAAAL